MEWKFFKLVFGWPFMIDWQIVVPKGSHFGQGQISWADEVLHDELKLRRIGATDWSAEMEEESGFEPLLPVKEFKNFPPIYVDFDLTNRQKPKKSNRANKAKGGAEKRAEKQAEKQAEDEAAAGSSNPAPTPKPAMLPLKFVN